MAIKAMIFAGRREIYEEFIKRHQLNETWCRHVTTIEHTRGYHKGSNPNLILIFLDEWWLTPICHDDRLNTFAGEFKGNIFHEGIADVAAALLNVESITDTAALPAFLSHSDDNVRKAAARKLEELEAWRNLRDECTLRILGHLPRCKPLASSQRQ